MLGLLAFRRLTAARLCLVRRRIRSVDASLLSVDSFIVVLVVVRGMLVSCNVLCLLGASRNSDSVRWGRMRLSAACSALRLLFVR